MNIYKIFVICVIGIILVTTSTVFSNEVYGYSKSSRFVQDTNFTVTEVKDGLMKIDGWVSSGFVGNGTMSVILELENGSKVSHNDIKKFDIDFGRGFVLNNDVVGPDTRDANEFAAKNSSIGNGFVQNNNITLSGGDQVGNGFVQNNNITLSSGDQVGNNEGQATGTNAFGNGEGYSGFVQNNVINGDMSSGG
jgi:hypothetical protein